MKSNIFLVFVLVTMFAFAQEQKPNLLQTSDDSWQIEKIHMPLHFAPQIPYAGMEELRFSKDWSNPEKEGFLSYTFVWDIDLKTLLTAQQLEADMRYYFNGLMGVVNKEKDKKLPKTIALFLQKETKPNSVSFVGKVQIYNAFHTKDVMILNCTVEQFYCPEKQTSLVLFRFSPKEFSHSVWDELHTVELTGKPCEE